MCIRDRYYRLNVFPIQVPPLRKRGEDILVLAKAFLSKFSRQHNLSIPGFTPEAETTLMEHSWPGNVRELQNTIERSVILAHNGEAIPPEYFALTPSASMPILRDPDPPTSRPTAPKAKEEEVLTEGVIEDGTSPAASVTSANGYHHEDGTLKPLEMIEQEQILRTLEHTNGNRSAAAELLGINIRTLRNKINKYKEDGISVP